MSTETEWVAKRKIELKRRANLAAHREVIMDVDSNGDEVL